jgi:dihydrofolate synthase/folylpolyglutamate synthase
MTALAMEAFRHEHVDWGIFEVGLGGRLDATNILEPRWTVITSIGLEHTAQLGSRLSEIAHEKAGIIKPGIDVFTGPMPSEAEAEIRRVAARNNARVVPVAGDRVRPAPHGGLYLEALDAVVPVGPVLGPALRADLALALEVYRSIARDDGETPDVTVVGAALETLVLPARVEVFDTDPCVVLDSAHTTESLEALGLALEEREVPRPRTVVFALSKGKELASILRCLPEIAEEIIFTHADEVRSVPPAELRDHFGGGEVIQKPEDAFARAIERSLPVIVTGSFFLSGRLRRMVRGLVRKK